MIENQTWSYFSGNLLLLTSKFYEASEKLNHLLAHIKYPVNLWSKIEVVNCGKESSQIWNQFTSHVRKISRFRNRNYFWKRKLIFLSNNFTVVGVFTLFFYEKCSKVLQNTFSKTQHAKFANVDINFTYLSENASFCGFSAQFAKLRILGTFMDRKSIRPWWVLWWE